MNEFETILNNFLLSIGPLGYVLSCLLLFLEAIIPILPATIFITILIYKFGPILGFVISYICSVFGSVVIYNVFRGKFSIKFNDYIKRKNRDKLNKIVNKIKNIKFVNLCLIIALPFTPQFLVHISCGLMEINKKKYLLSLFIGKIFVIIFWGFIGTSLITSLKNPINLLKSSLIVLEKLNLNSPNSFVKSVSNLPNLSNVSLLFFLNINIICNIITTTINPITT